MDKTDKKELLNWARSDFERHRKETDIVSARERFNLSIGQQLTLLRCI
jgi:hypothetical protein